MKFEKRKPQKGGHSRYVALFPPPVTVGMLSYEWGILDKCGHRQYDALEYPTHGTLEYSVLLSWKIGFRQMVE